MAPREEISGVMSLVQKGSMVRLPLFTPCLANIFAPVHPVPVYFPQPSLIDILAQTGASTCFMFQVVHMFQVERGPTFQFDQLSLVQIEGGTLQQVTVQKTVALLRQLNQLTVRTASVCQSLCDDTAAVQTRVAALAGRITVAESAASDLERARAAGMRPIQSLEYDGTVPSTFRIFKFALQLCFLWPTSPAGRLQPNLCVACMFAYLLTQWRKIMRSRRAGA